MNGWTVMYNLRTDREPGEPTLPKPSAMLAEQKAAARALKVLYPGIKVRLSSIRTKGETRIVKELRV